MHTVAVDLSQMRFLFWAPHSISHLTLCAVRECSNCRQHLLLRSQHQLATVMSFTTPKLGLRSRWCLQCQISRIVAPQPLRSANLSYHLLVEHHIMETGVAHIILTKDRLETC